MDPLFSRPVFNVVGSQGLAIKAEKVHLCVLLLARLAQRKLHSLALDRTIQG